MKPKRRELTLLAIVLGAGLAVVMGAANVYLGLKAGMTVSASIPAAVVAMGILAALRRRNVLEANMVQTGASAGESLAAGVIFTLPALVMIGYWQQFDFWTTAAVSLAGGLLGILFMIPMRKVFIANSPELPYPEGVACAEVLRAGAHSQHDEDEVEASTGGLALILGALLVGGLFKLATKSLGLIKENIAWATERAGHVYAFGMSISPALIAVGLIVGLPIASQVFAGGVIGYFIVLPLIP
ncbi:MAG: oligopeptide transporter, OPT family, partial [Pirellulales bacterium]